MKIGFPFLLQKHFNILIHEKNSKLYFLVILPLSLERFKHAQKKIIKKSHVKQNLFYLIIIVGIIIVLPYISTFSFTLKKPLQINYFICFFILFIYSFI